MASVAPDAAGKSHVEASSILTEALTTATVTATAYAYNEYMKNNDKNNENENGDEYSNASNIHKILQELYTGGSKYYSKFSSIAYDNLSPMVEAYVPESFKLHVLVIRKAINATVVAIMLWIEVIMPIITGVIALVKLVFPFVLDFSHFVGEYLWYFGTKTFYFCYPYVESGALSAYQGLIETDPVTMVLVTVSIFALYYFTRLLRYIYGQRHRVYNFFSLKFRFIKKQIIRSGNAVSSSVYHLLFLFIGLSTAFYLPDVNEYIATNGFFFVAYLLPVYISLRTRRKAIEAIEASEDGILLHWIMYWVVIDLCLLYYFIPLIPNISQTLFSQLSQFRMLVALWMWFPKTGGADVVYRTISPLINKFVARIPQGGSENEGYWKMFLTMICNFIPEQYSWVATNLKNASFLTLIAVVFFFTTWYLTMWGCLFFGLLYPTYCTMIDLNTFLSQTEKLNKNQKQKAIYWLEYWIAYSIFKCLHTKFQQWLEFVPFFFYDVELAYILILRLKGSTQIIDFLSNQPLSARNKIKSLNEPEQVQSEQIEENGDASSSNNNNNNNNESKKTKRKKVSK